MLWRSSFCETCEDVINRRLHIQTEHGTTQRHTLTNTAVKEQNDSVTKKTKNNKKTYCVTHRTTSASDSVQLITLRILSIQVKNGGLQQASGVRVRQPRRNWLSTQREGDCEPVIGR